jgi:hypothetical protein
MKQVLSFTALVVALLALTLAKPALAKPLEGYIPIFAVSDPTVASPGGTVTITVGLNGTPSQSQQVAIAGSSHWASIPSSVTVQAGHSSVSFNATLKTNASGGATVSASCNGGSVLKDIPIDTP